MWQIIGISCLAGLSTPLGAWIVLRLRTLSARTLSFFLGLASGIMVTVILTDLMPMSIKLGGHRTFFWGACAGWIFLWGIRFLVNRAVRSPVTHNDSHAKQTNPFRALGWFIAIAIALHDIPEGIAIGAGGAAQHSLAIVVAVAIAIHNIPEGMSIAAPMLLGGEARSRVFLTTVVTGFVTPLGTLISLLIVRFSGSFISLSLAFASGAMACVVTQDMLPHSLAQSRLNTIVGASVGALVMFFVTSVGV